MVSFDVWRELITVIVLLFLGGVTIEWIVILCRVINTSRFLRHNKVTLLEQTISAMAIRPPQQWADWDIQLLRALEGRVDNGAYREALEMIRDKIIARLDAGTWQTA
jgi:hypothetical protein